MKRNSSYTILIFEVLFITYILVGCRGNMLNEQTSSKVETNLTGGNTELKDDEIEVSAEMFFDYAQKLPQYDIREVDIESILSEKEEIRVVWDIKILAERVCFGVTTYDETNGFSNRLVTCNLSGDDVKGVLLQKPETKSEVCNLISHTIGMDGNVYAVKYEKEQILLSCTEEGTSIVSWNSDGEIRYELRLQPSDFESYENSLVRIESVSEQGEIFFSITDYNRAIVACASSDGSVRNIKESEGDGVLYSSWINKDGSMSWFILEGNRNDEYDMFYLTYDINLQDFSEQIQVNDDVLNARSYGKSKEEIILYEKGVLYKYYPLNNQIGPLAQVGEDRYVNDVAVVNDESFVIYFISETDSQNPFEGVYIYTRSNE